MFVWEFLDPSNIEPTRKKRIELKFNDIENIAAIAKEG